MAADAVRLLRDLADEFEQLAVDSGNLPSPGRDDHRGDHQRFFE